MDLADVGERLKKETAVLFMIYYVTSFQCLHESLRLRIVSVTVESRDLKKKTATRDRKKRERDINAMVSGED